MYPYLVSNFKSLIHSCNFRSPSQFKPFFSTCFQDGCHEVLPSLWACASPCQERVYSFPPLECTWAFMLVWPTGSSGSDILCFEVRSKETLLLLPESLGIIALESELLCNDGDYPETTILWEALWTLRGLEEREMPRNSQAPTCGWNNHLGNGPTLQSQLPPLAPCWSKPTTAEPFSNSWPTKSWGKLKWLF